MRFVSLDVETANPDRSSICQIGVVRFIDGAPADSWKSLINPRDYFDPVNVSIHGINERAVKDAPGFKDIFDRLTRWVGEDVVVAHTAFDRSAITRAATKIQCAHPPWRWLDTACVARRAWPEVAVGGYGLASMAYRLAIDFEHHDALEDARAAGLVLVHAAQATGMNIEQWLARVRQPIDGGNYSKFAREGNPDGALYGEVLVFTGTLSMPRREAAELASKAGCEVADGVTKRTTLLIVGDSDARLLRGHDKSSKHRKAEDLIAKGVAINILSESDFTEICREYIDSATT